MERLCKIRDMYRSIAEFEARFEECYGLCLNEGMLLCTLSNSEKGQLSSGELAEHMGLTTSNTSKVLRSVEKKGLVNRIMGEKDRRQMYFSLTDTGREALKKIKCSEIELPPLLESWVTEMP